MSFTHTHTPAQVQAHTQTHRQAHRQFIIYVCMYSIYLRFGSDKKLPSSLLSALFTRGSTSSNEVSKTNVRKVLRITRQASRGLVRYSNKAAYLDNQISIISSSGHIRIDLIS